MRRGPGATRHRTSSWPWPSVRRSSVQGVACRSVTQCRARHTRVPACLHQVTPATARERWRSYGGGCRDNRHGWQKSALALIPITGGSRHDRKRLLWQMACESRRPTCARHRSASDCAALIRSTWRARTISQGAKYSKTNPTISNLRIPQGLRGVSPRRASRW